MSTLAVPPSPAPVEYPDSDGKPMAENTLQWDWIVKIVAGLKELFADRPEVFVAGDLFWYPVKGHPEIVMAPDALVAFGRPRGWRPSYMQWEEGDVPPQVVFEVLSRSNRFGEMMRKFEFYRRYGVEEYYIYDPEPARLDLSGFLRRGTDLVEIQSMNGHVSPRLKVKFEMGVEGLQIIRPDGRPFVVVEELARQREQERQRADREKQRADEEKQRADEEKQRADRLQAELDRQRREARPPGA